MEEQDNPRLYKIRHSLAHILAQAVKQQFPKAQLGFGPPTDTGFFYDFDLGSESLREEDLRDIEKRMKKIIRQRQKFSRQDLDAAAAAQKLGALGETYKVQNVANLKERGATVFSFYDNGEFVDLCEGPHVEHTGEIPENVFQLERIAGAYWLGDEKNKMLTRIYGLAFETREELEAFLKRRKIAEEFDHKKLGKELDIYHQHDIIGKGLILWMPNGTVIRDEIEQYAKDVEFKYGYQRVATPHIAKSDLYLRSQHLPAYKESMFPPMVVDEEGHRTEYYLKPMNCPHHHLIFESRLRSYRDLPLRLAEYGTTYRYEQSGELSGLIRVRCMTLNDAHIYIRPDQFESEFKHTMKLYEEFYSTFKLKGFKYRLSVTDDENRDKFKGDPKKWQEAEAMLTRVMDDLGLEYFVGKGEAAFYGPKIDVQFKNLMGREETVSTIQVDFLSPTNFNLKYIDEHGKEATPIILHRSPLSTHERFTSFLMEYYGGAFPTWCAPVQVCIVPVSEQFLEYANSLRDEMFAKRLRVEVDDSSNTLNKKIRTNTVRKIPIMLIVGEKEVQAQTVTVRRYGTQEQVSLGRQDFLDGLQQEIRDRVMLREPMSSIV